MPLTNAQYDSIMRHYDEKQAYARQQHSLKMAEVRDRLPGLASLDAEIASMAVEIAKQRLSGNDEEVSRLREKLSGLRARKTRLLTSAGYSPKDLEIPYSCSACRDTGYVNGKKCKCFTQASINEIYSQSNIQEVLKEENFDFFSFDLFSDQPLSKENGQSPRASIRRAVSICRHFIDDFEKEHENLLFFGDTGVGKTFLTNCVAKELLDKNYSVIYFTSFELFDIFSKGVFGKDADAISANRQIFDCDLLIIDDLGTELTNTFVTSQLFLCVNERILRKKSTIISTNLGLSQLIDRYSERTFSRISKNYTIIKLFGEDLRMKVRQTPSSTTL